MKTAGAALALSLLIAAVFSPYLEVPIRLYDHHLLLLLAEKPELAGEGLAWRLLHCHFGSETDIHFRYLAYPAVWLAARAFGNDSAAHYGLQFAAHAAAALSLYGAVRAFTGLGWLAFLASLLFGVFCGSSDMVGVPYYFHLCLATALAGPALVFLRRAAASGRARDLAAATGLSLLASLFYDTFVFMTLSAPFAAAALAEGSWKRGLSRRAPWVLAGSVLALFLAGSALYARIPPHLRSTGVGGSLADTAGIILVRLPIALATSAVRFLFDGTSFLAGRLPEMSHPGNLPYWEVGSLAGTAALLSAAALLAALGARQLTRQGIAQRILGAALCAAGAALDWRGIPVGLLAFLVRGGAPGLLRDPGFLLVAVVGYLCALNTSVGRSRFYSMAAIRHHYVTAFFLILAVSILAARAVSADPRPALRRGIAAVLGLLAALNADAALRVIAAFKETNAAPLAFSGTLADLAARDGPRALFVPHTLAMIRSPDWRGHAVGDWVFDILHSEANPLSRHSGRARWLWEGNVPVPNPVFGVFSRDFLAGFRLDTEKFPLRFDAKPRYDCFGRKPGEPRLALERDGIVLDVVGAGDGRPARYRFPLPGGTNRFFYETKSVALRRSGDLLTLEADDGVLAERPLDAEFLPWESDNLDLLGADFEALLAKHNLFDSYLRIGPGLPGRIP